MSLHDWREARIRAGAQGNAQLTAAARERGVVSAYGLQGLSDDELIARSPARSSLSYAHHEMEMQRRLKDATEANTAETRLARRSSDRGSLIMTVLTAAIVALTIVLALKA